MTHVYESFYRSRRGAVSSLKQQHVYYPYFMCDSLTEFWSHLLWSFREHLHHTASHLCSRNILLLYKSFFVGMLHHKSGVTAVTELKRRIFAQKGRWFHQPKNLDEGVLESQFVMQLSKTSKCPSHERGDSFGFNLHQWCKLVISYGALQLQDAHAASAMPRLNKHPHRNTRLQVPPLSLCAHVQPCKVSVIRIQPVNPHYHV